MKSINFINTLSAKQHKKLIRWYQTSVALFIALMIGISIVTFRQYNLLGKLKKEQQKVLASSAEFDATMSAKHTLKQQEATLKQKIETIAQLTMPEKNPATLLSALQKAMGSTAWIESITLEKTNLSMMILCDHGTNAMNLMKDLQQLPSLEHLVLLSLQPKTHEEHTFLRINMKANWKQG